jgi:hypothetical protein
VSAGLASESVSEVKFDSSGQSVGSCMSALLQHANIQAYSGLVLSLHVTMAMYNHTVIVSISLARCGVCLCSQHGLRWL